jgi:hypothetical protein
MRPKHKAGWFPGVILVLLSFGHDDTEAMKPVRHIQFYYFEAGCELLGLLGFWTASVPVGTCSKAGCTDFDHISLGMILLNLKVHFVEWR